MARTKSLESIPRIFHFILDHRIGGPHVYVSTLIRALGNLTNSTLVTTGKGALTEISLTNLRHRLKALYPVEVLWNVLRLLWMFRTRISRSGCIFDVHGGANIAPLLAVRLLGIPVVWHIHETWKGVGVLVRIGQSIIAGVPHRMVVVAQSSAKIFGIADAEQISAPIDTAYWTVTDRQREMRASGGVLRIVAVGNLNPLKGMDVLLDSLGSFAATWELVIVGAELSTFRAYSSLLREKAETLSHGSGKVRFTGWLSPDSVRELLSSADVFVLPSRSEAWPIALLEAMSMECVCVATDVGDVRHIIGGSDAGIVIPSESVPALRQALTEIQGITPKGRKNFGAAARARVEEISSPGRIADRHLSIYLELSQCVKSSGPSHQ